MRPVFTTRAIISPSPPVRFVPNALKNLLVSLEQAGDFDEIIDVRTPLEFAEDHIPGALNAPVLSNEERVLVGTTYKQVSPFEATRIGAALVARNIAHHRRRLSPTGRATGGR